MEKKRSLKWQMTGMMLLCWLVPVVLVLCVLGWYVADSLSQRTAQNLADQFQVNLRMCADRLDTAVEASRLATYDPRSPTPGPTIRRTGTTPPSTARPRTS